MKNFTLVIFTAIIAILLTYFLTRNHYQKEPTQSSAAKVASPVSEIEFSALDEFMQDSLNTPQFKLSGGSVLKSSLQAIIDSSHGNTLSILIGTGDSLGGNNTCMAMQSEDHSVRILWMQNNNRDTMSCCIVVAPCCPPPSRMFVSKLVNEEEPALSK